jgi:hypothetical protein
MSTSRIARAVATAALLSAAAAAQAGFITMDSADPAASTITVVDGNDFKGTLAGVGITTYTLGASLGTDTAGTVTYYYYGKEAGYRNDFLAGGLSPYSSGYTPTTQNYFGAPKTIGSQSVGAGLLDFSFCAYGYDASLQGCVSNAQNDGLGLYSWQSIAMSILGDSAWLFWDDSGAGPDDNHDDMIIRAVFTPRASVPEPGTIGLFGLGLLGVWFAARQRKAQLA